MLRAPGLAPLAGVRHGFFTRVGGVSRREFASLNCGYSSGDDAAAVAANRARALRRLGVAPASLCMVRQVHGADVVIAREPEPGRPSVEADALITDRPGVTLGVLTADCAPVLMADPQAGVIGAIHAGWRGALDGVLEATLDAMERLGARRARVRAAVGPTISQRAYEVGPEFFERFSDEAAGYERFFAPGEGDRLRFDLPGFVLDRLRAAGVAEAGWIGRCTYSEPDRFFSYRRTTHAGEADYGRLISAIRI
jgi:YfiH family protein